MADVTLKLTIGAFSVEVTGPAEYAEKKLEELVGRYVTAGRSTTSEVHTPASAPRPEVKEVAVAEFLRKVGHKNQRDRALTFGYHLEKSKGQSNFTTGELGDLGQETKYPFGNVSDVVGKLVSRGLMMSAGEKDGQRGYALTASGEEYVESMLELKR